MFQRGDRGRPSRSTRTSSTGVAVLAASALGLAGCMQIWLQYRVDGAEVERLWLGCGDPCQVALESLQRNGRDIDAALAALQSTAQNVSGPVAQAAILWDAALLFEARGDWPSAELALGKAVTFDSRPELAAELERVQKRPEHAAPQGKAPPQPSPRATELVAAVEQAGPPPGSPGVCTLMTPPAAPKSPLPAGKWDGAAPFLCDGHGDATFENLDINLPNDEAMVLDGNCTIHIVNSTIRAKIPIRSKGNTSLTLVNTKLEGSVEGIHLQGNDQVSVFGGSIRGPDAIVTLANGFVTLHGTSVEGTSHAVRAEGNSSVQNHGSCFTGPLAYRLPNAHVYSVGPRWDGQYPLLCRSTLRFEGLHINLPGQTAIEAWKGCQLTVVDSVISGAYVFDARDDAQVTFDGGELRLGKDDRTLGYVRDKARVENDGADLPRQSRIVLTGNGQAEGFGKTELSR